MPSWRHCRRFHLWFQMARRPFLSSTKYFSLWNTAFLDLCWRVNYSGRKCILKSAVTGLCFFYWVSCYFLSWMNFIKASHPDEVAMIYQTSSQILQRGFLARVFFSTASLVAKQPSTTAKNFRIYELRMSAILLSSWWRHFILSSWHVIFCFQNAPVPTDSYFTSCSWFWGF